VDHDNTNNAKASNDNDEDEDEMMIHETIAVQDVNMQYTVFIHRMIQRACTRFPGFPLWGGCTNQVPSIFTQNPV